VGEGTQGTTKRKVPKKGVDRANREMPDPTGGTGKKRGCKTNPGKVTIGGWGKRKLQQP